MNAFRPPCAASILLFACLAALSTQAADKYKQADAKYKIANEGGIREDWVAADGAKFVAPGYPAAFAARGDDVCIAMGYAILADGSTTDFSVIKAWSNSRGEDQPEAGFWDSFSQAGATALSQWKFKPRVADRAVPTYTVATLMFQGAGKVSTQDLRARCGVADLKVALADSKSKRFMNSMGKHTMDIDRQTVDRASIKANAAQAAGWALGGN